MASFQFWRFGLAGSLLAALVAFGGGVASASGSRASQTSTTTSLTSSANPVAAGAEVTYTATVTAIQGAGTPTGTVDFTDDGTTIGRCGAVALSGGTASCFEISYSTTGTQGPIVATYSGSAAFGASSSAGLTERVVSYSSQTTVQATPSTVTAGATATFTATVVGPEPDEQPAGTVTFTTDSVTPTALCTATLSAEIATCSTKTAPVGPDGVVATYGGSDLFEGSVGTNVFTVTPGPNSHGYWLVGSDGGIFTFGSAVFFGSTGNLKLNRPVVGITPTTDKSGYWLVASDGGVFTFGDAGFVGSIPGLGLAPAGSAAANRLNAPIVGMVPSATGQGYFLVGADGGVFAFNATFAGSCPAIVGGCSGVAVGVAPDASGNGYWLVTATGHVYAFGDAPYLGAPGPQASTITAIERTPDGNGYWVLDANGQLYAYGDARYLGGLPAGAAGGLDPASALMATSDGGGYWITTAEGSVTPFGDAPNEGSVTFKLNGPIIAGAGF